MRSRYETARRILVFWTLFIGIGAVGGAAMILLDPSGKTMGMDGMLPYFQVLPFAEVVFQDLAFSGIALSVEAVMRWFANDLGYGEEADFWAMCGLLHDIDFEKWPEQHCVKAPELLRPAGVGEEMIHAICSHGHKICTDVAPEKEMEKVLFACDELTGLIGAAALMRPSKSTTDMELSSVKKKFKDKKFAAGCSREVIKDGAELLGWELNTLIQKTLTAMQQSEAGIREELAALLG